LIRNPLEKDHLLNLAVGGRIILKLVLKKYFIELGTGDLYLALFSITESLRIP
jgi:hypothetical protein